MMEPLWPFFTIVIWLKKTSLPKLYFRMSSKRGTSIKNLRHIERYGLKRVKLKSDIKFFETCANLDIFPQFLKFKVPTSRFVETQKTCMV